jgi:hypothetical protein
VGVKSVGVSDTNAAASDDKHAASAVEAGTASRVARQDGAAGNFNRMAVRKGIAGRGRRVSGKRPERPPLSKESPRLPLREGGSSFSRRTAGFTQLVRFRWARFTAAFLEAAQT